MKTQISLHICTVWSVFVIRMKKLCILGCPKCTQWMHRLIWLFTWHTCPNIRFPRLCLIFVLELYIRRLDRYFSSLSIKACVVYTHHCKGASNEYITFDIGKRPLRCMRAVKVCIHAVWSGHSLSFDIYYSTH